MPPRTNTIFIGTFLLAYFIATNADRAIAVVEGSNGAQSAYSNVFMPPQPMAGPPKYNFVGYDMPLGEWGYFLSIQYFTFSTKYDKQCV